MSIHGEKHLIADALSSHQLPLLNSQLSQRVRFAESALDGLSVYDYPDKRNFAADDSAEKTKRVSLDIPADIHRKLKLQAMDKGKTTITLVREILAEKFV
ncbi:hypothetical protein [Zymomonas mobilis]|uniref:Uncharacterized protein n=1 Tax=Zymomonas mobilis subsp. pomaceae (strain ATCC 29192 / DSM 22645 / JCM 10191 / CCUG 17912 / NBRC 13757 / NCIMB 11200 / NRRL B-4491 / Barker I) TaxID=579138 RepID=F8EWH9_ZYMMT|nr:hypothetical protein [Zymomonas mobilis]AEI38622.1 hypothetical protein Zymop_2038 [Zymomonas mobilis subsp. pomaceae ATCC 29192]MDX5947811.1 hypothetical protein [Zymomonas mobilis subsp. pomaceae]GEB90101.1 hypothetical protein ZMO02_17380 [Zymomonas mobilis subsp. pomaceae]